MRNLWPRVMVQASRGRAQGANRRAGRATGSLILWAICFRVSPRASMQQVQVSRSTLTGATLAQSLGTMLDQDIFDRMAGVQ